MKVIKIKWVDSSAGANEWEYLEGLEPLKPVIIDSVGFLIEETETYCTICSSKSDTQILGRITIPNRAIVFKDIIDFKDIS